MGTQKTVQIWTVVLVTVSLLAACGDAEPGSQEDLRAQVDSIDLPAGMVELDDRYVSSSPAPRPALVVWYQVTGPLEQTRAELLDALTQAGWDVNEASASFEVWSARNADHILFVVINQEMISRNPYAPAGTNAEITVQLLDNPPG